MASNIVLKLKLQSDVESAKAAFKSIGSELNGVAVALAKINAYTSNPKLLDLKLSGQKDAADAQRKYDKMPAVLSSKAAEAHAARRHERSPEILAAKAAESDAQRAHNASPEILAAKAAEKDAQRQHERLAVILQANAADADGQRQHEKTAEMISARVKEELSAKQHILDLEKLINVEKRKQNPNLIHDQVKQEKEAAAEKRKAAAEMTRERTKQWTPETFFGKIAKGLGGKAPVEAAPKGQGGGLQSMLEGVGVGGEEGAGALVGELGSLGEVLGPVGIAAGVAVAGLGAAKGALDSFIGSVISASAKAQPGALIRFNLALDDMQAVVGQRTLPLMNLFSDGVRLTGDFLQSILPSMGQVQEAISPLRDMFSDLGTVLKDVAPALKLLAHGALIDLKIGLTLITAPLRLAAKLFDSLYHSLGGKTEGLKSSAGAAGKGITFGDQDSAARSIYQAAYASGSPTSSVPDLLSENGAIYKMLLTINTGVDVIAQVAETFGKGGKQAVATVGDAANAATGGIAADVGKAMRRALGGW